MSANLPSTSDSADGPARSSSRVFILTPDMLKKLGLADKVSLIQTKSKPESTVQLVKEPGSTAKMSITPKLIIPSDRVKIIPKKAHDRQPVDVKRRISFDSSLNRLQRGHTVVSACKSSEISKKLDEKLEERRKIAEPEGENVAVSVSSSEENKLNQIDSFNPPNEIETREESSVASERLISIPRMKKIIKVHAFKRRRRSVQQVQSSVEMVATRISEENLNQLDNFSGVISREDNVYTEVRHGNSEVVEERVKTQLHQVNEANKDYTTERTKEDGKSRETMLKKPWNLQSKSLDDIQSKEPDEFKKNFSNSLAKSSAENTITIEAAGSVSIPKDNQINITPEIDKSVDIRLKNKLIQSSTNISYHLLSAVSQEVETLRQMSNFPTMRKSMKIFKSSSPPGGSTNCQKVEIARSERVPIASNSPSLISTESDLGQLPKSDSLTLISSRKTPDKPENSRKRISPEVKAEVDNADEDVSPPKTEKKLKPVITDIQVIPKSESPNLPSQVSSVQMPLPTCSSPSNIQQVKKEGKKPTGSSGEEKTLEKIDEPPNTESSEKTQVASLKLSFKRKKTRIVKKLDVAKGTPRSRKAAQQKKIVNDLEIGEEKPPPVLAKETAETPSPVRISRRAPKLKIFENCITYPMNRRKSAQPNKENSSLVGKQRRRTSKIDCCSSDSPSATQSSLNCPIFVPLFEDCDSPRKLVIDESKFHLPEVENVALHCDVKQSERNVGEKASEFEPPSVQKRSRKSSETSLSTAKMKIEGGEDEIDCATISRQPSGDVEPPAKTRRTRRRSSIKLSTAKESRRVVRKSSHKSHRAASPIATAYVTIESSKPPAVPEEKLGDENIEMEFCKIVSDTPETSKISGELSAKVHGNKPQQNPAETPTETTPVSDSQTCKEAPGKTSERIPLDSADCERPDEFDETVALAVEKFSPVRGGRGRWRTRETHPQSPVTEVLSQPSVISNSADDELTSTDVKTPSQESKPPPKCRGRKRKLELLLLQPPESTEASPPVPELVEESETPESRSRKPPVRLDEIDGKGLSSSEEETSVISEQASSAYSRRGRGRGRGRGRRGRGRGRGRRAAPTDRDYIPRCVTASSPPGPRPLITSKTVKCAKCNEEMASSVWAKHNLTKHNNMGWREGEEEPDFSDINFLTRFLTKTKKKKSTLICETCGSTKRSAIGFISHIQFCGKTDEEKQALMWTCPICRATFMPSSQDYHEKTHREEAPSVRLGAEREAEEKGAESFLGKRKAAQRAATKISEFTELVKASEDPPVHPRGRQKSAKMVHDFIEQPALFKKIPNVWKGCWKRAIDSGQPALCRQPGCTFSTSKLECILEHYSQCNFTPKTTMSCKICKFFSESQEEIEKHVRDKHADKITTEDSDFVASDTDDSEEGAEDADHAESKVKRLHKVRVAVKSKFLLSGEAMQTARGNVSFIAAFKWTLDFEEKHHRFYVFDDLKPGIFTLVQNFEAYLPQLKTSMAVTHSTSKKKQEELKDWKRWDRFESAVVDNIPTLFTGGPVWALAWLPLPTPLYDRELRQYIAVSTHPTMEASYEVGRAYAFKNSIQIWDLGHLAHDVATPEVPKLCYLVAHEAGTIWSLQWCPSGAYQHEDLGNLQTSDIADKVRRMGLLAAATSSGLVHIYALPFPEDLPDVQTSEADGSKGPKVVKTAPVMTLHTNSAIEIEFGTSAQCMTLSWSKTAKHDTLAAGFSNGFVAVWELNTKSSLLRRKEGSTEHLDACRHFYAHGHAVTFVAVIPFAEKRYLATAGLDRCSKVWDLEEMSTQLWCLKRGVAVNGAWMTHWPAILTAYDDVLGLSHTQTYFAPFREVSNRVLPMLPTNSTTYGLDVSDWGNAISHGTLGGEIVAIFPPQLLYLREIDKLSRKRWLVSDIDVVDLKEKRKTEHSKDYEYMPESYEKCQERFGIAFHDDVCNVRATMWKYRSKKKAFLCSETMKLMPVEQYPFAAVNRVVWNPNAWSYLCLAAGYQNGLIRILNLKRMSIDSIIHDLLAEHAKVMLDRVNQFRASR